MVWTFRLAAILSLLASPSVVLAQSATTGAIAGVVRDETGAVVPGVTVEASSPALIEKVRTVTTDGGGLYKIVELRPGAYTVTFTLTGFSTVKREGIELTTGFTATVNADMKVGSLQETITVSGASPIVDTQNVRTQNVLSREVLDLLPTAKTVQGFAAMTIGTSVTTGGGGGSNHDVGGNKGDQYGGLNFHGTESNDGRMLFDGMVFNATVATGGGPHKHYWVNQNDVQEVVLEVSGMAAEAETSGARINMVPKSGGNRFAGVFSVTGNTDRMRADNFSAELQQRGLTAVSELKKTYDVGGGFGGPFVREKLWFYTAHRWWGSGETAVGNFYNKTQGTPFYTPDPARPGFTDYYNQDSTVRLTWQPAAKHKITGSYSHQNDCQCHLFVDRGDTAPETALDFDYYGAALAQASWTYPLTNRLLVQAGGTWLGDTIRVNPAPEVKPTDVPIIELSRNYNYNAPNKGLGVSQTGHGYDFGQHNERVSLSYVTGAHAFKTGVFTLSGVSKIGYSYINQDITYLFSGGKPQTVQLWASPRQNTDSRIKLNLGIYGQDQWTMKRLTLNLGVRYDSFNGYVPAQTRPGGQFVKEISFSRVDNVPNFKDISPRIGVAYDLFGDGRTALKASVGRYVASLGASFVDAINPANAVVQSTNRVWNDQFFGPGDPRSGNYLPDCILTNFEVNGECGVIDNRAFGTVVVNRQYAKDTTEGWGNRTYNWQTAASVQQQLGSRTAVNVGYFYRTFGNFTVTDNLEVTPADFDPFCIKAPTDSRLPGGGGYQVCDLGDVKPAKFGRVNNLVILAPGQLRTYQGVDATLSSRFGHGGIFGGGVSTGRTMTQCVVVDGPIQFCRNEQPVLTQFKFNGTYPLPWWGLHTSATYQNLPGNSPTTGVSTPVITYVPTNAEIAPSLGRDLSACRGVSPCNTSGAAVQLAAPSSVLEDRLSQLDFRLMKTFKLGPTRVQGMFDIYNIFNASTVLDSTGRYSPATYLLPLSVMGGRTFKFGAQMDF